MLTCMYNFVFNIIFYPKTLYCHSGGLLNGVLILIKNEYFDSFVSKKLNKYYKLKIEGKI